MGYYYYHCVVVIIFVSAVSIVIIAAIIIVIVIIIIIISIIILPSVVPGAGCSANPGLATRECRSLLRSQALSAFSSSPSVLG